MHSGGAYINPFEICDKQTVIAYVNEELDLNESKGVEAILDIVPELKEYEIKLRNDQVFFDQELLNEVLLPLGIDINEGDFDDKSEKIWDLIGEKILEGNFLKARVPNRIIVGISKIAAVFLPILATIGLLVLFWNVSGQRKLAKEAGEPIFPLLKMPDERVIVEGGIVLKNEAYKAQYPPTKVGGNIKKITEKRDEIAKNHSGMLWQKQSWDIEPMLEKAIETKDSIEKNIQSLNNRLVLAQFMNEMKKMNSRRSLYATISSDYGTNKQEIRKLKKRIKNNKAKLRKVNRKIARFNKRQRQEVFFVEFNLDPRAQKITCRSLTIEEVNLDTIQYKEVIVLDYDPRLDSILSMHPKETNTIKDVDIEQLKVINGVLCVEAASGKLFKVILSRRENGLIKVSFEDLPRTPVGVSKKGSSSDCDPGSEK